MTLERASADLRAARDCLDIAITRASDAAVEAVESGMSEVRVAAALGVNRLTVRKWLGK